MMQLDRYFDFLNESKVVYSSEFVDILTKMKKHSKVAKDLLNLSGREMDLVHNYIDICPGKDDTILYIPDNKVKPEQLDKYEIVNRGRCHVRSNRIFRFAGLSEDHIPCPPLGTLCVLHKIFSLTDLRTVTRDIERPVAWFKTLEGYNFFMSIHPTNRDQGVVGAYDLEGAGVRKFPFPVGIKPSEFKVGRFAKRILATVGIEVSDKEVESFVNQYKSEIAKLNDVFRNLKLVEGEEIRKWYHELKYRPGTGTLNGSCMRYPKCQPFFDIYVLNPDKCKMLILLDDVNPELIVGRALIWKLEDGTTFMDRIYYIKDATVNVFKDYAISMGWKYKLDQNNQANSPVMLGDKKCDDQKLEVKLKLINYRYFPYMDTIKFLDRFKDHVLITNHKGRYVLEQTNGGGAGRCEECGGSGRVTCGHCGGDCDITCYDCDGDGETTCRKCRGGGTIDCDKCSGDGERECSTCTGTGIHDGKECTDCGAKGVVKCEACAGKGNIECSSCDGNGNVSCRRCRGNGRIECDECEGNGDVSCPECS